MKAGTAAVFAFILAFSAFTAVTSAESFSYTVTAAGTQPGHEYKSFSAVFSLSCDNLLFGCSEDKIQNVCIQDSSYEYERCYHQVSHSHDGSGSIQNMWYSNGCCYFKGHVGCGGYCESKISGPIYIEGKKVTTINWSGGETGISSVSAGEHEKAVASSKLSAPDGNTQWYITDDNNKVMTWMNGRDIYACLDADANGACDYLTAAGIISVNKVMPESSITIPKGGTFGISGMITCTQGDCGSVSAYVRYNKTSAVPDSMMLAEAWEPVFITNSGSHPKDCDEMGYGSECPFEWTADAGTAGHYIIDVIAVSSKPGVVPADSNDANIKVEPGRIAITSFNIEPVIEEGKEAVLSVVVQCAMPPCGNVMAYLMEGENMIKHWNLTTQSGNPQSCPASPGNACSFEWIVKGESAGLYELRVLAQPSEDDVRAAEARANITVTPRPVGEFYFSPNMPFTIEPSSVNILGQATVTAVILCSMDYCGEVSTRLMVNGKNAGDFANNITMPSAVRLCTMFPCNVSWNVIPHTPGAYRLSVVALTNESSAQKNDSGMLFVNDPAMSVPALYASLAMPTYYDSGSSFKIKASVECHNKKCGTVNAHLTCDGNRISSLTPVKIISGSENMAMELNEGDREELEWLVLSETPGSYTIGITAVPANNSFMGGGDQKTVTIIRNVSVTVLSPAKSVFFRGDSIDLAIKTIMHGRPVLGAPIVVNTFPELFTVVLSDDGRHGDGAPNDGVYGGSAKVPPVAASGSYDMVFNIEGIEKIIKISVLSKLVVSVSADRSRAFQGGTVVITGNVTKGGSPSDANVTITLSSATCKFVEEVETSDGRFLLSYPVSFGDPEGIWKIVASAKDLRGNSGAGAANFSVIGAAAGCVMKMNKPFDVSRGIVYSAGERMDVSIELSGCPGANVSCRAPGGSIALKDKGNGMHGAMYDIPIETPGGIYSVSCQAVSENWGCGTYSNIQIKEAGIIIGLVSPNALEGSVYAKVGETLRIAIRANYPGGGPALNATLKAVIGTEEVPLSLKDGIHEGKYLVEKEGIYAMNVVAYDTEGNTGKRSFDFVIGRNQEPQWPVVAAALIVMLLFGMFLIRKELLSESRKQAAVVMSRNVMGMLPGPSKSALLKADLERLERDEKSFEGAKDVTEKKYYKREIEEKAFRKMMESYEKKLIVIRLRIEETQKELSRCGGGREKVNIKEDKDKA
jgi:hypothetical protein